MQEKKCWLLFSNIFFRSRDILDFKISKLAKWWSHKLNQILIKFDEEKITQANLYQKCMIIWIKILLDVLRNMRLKRLLP